MACRNLCIEFYVSVCFFTLSFHTCHLPAFLSACTVVCTPECTLHCAHTRPRHTSTCVQRVAEKLASNGSVSISKAIRNKELEIIPISPTVKGSSSGSGSSTTHRDKSEPKVSISTVNAANARLSNGAATGAGWREEAASVSIEPCGPGATPTSSGSADDAPLNLSMKAGLLKPPG